MGKGTGKKKDPNALGAALLDADNTATTAKQDRREKPKKRDKKASAPSAPPGYSDLGGPSDSLYQASLTNGTVIGTVINGTVTTGYGAPITQPMDRGNPVASAPPATMGETPKAQVIERGVGVKEEDDVITVTATPLNNPIASTDDLVETEAQRLAREKREREKKKESCCDICCDSCCYGSSSNSSNNVYFIYMGPEPTHASNNANNDPCCLTLCCPPRPDTCCPTFSNDQTSCCCLPCNMVGHLLNGVGNVLCGESGLLNGGCLKDCCPERPTCFNCDITCGNPFENISCCNPCDLLGQVIGASGDVCNLFGGCVSGCCEGLAQIPCSDCPCPN